MTESEYLRRPDAAGYLKVLDALRRWDPIGVLSDPDCPGDEYDGYAASVARQLDRGVSADELAQILHQISSDQMGIESNGIRDMEIATELVDYWKEKRSGSE